MSYSQNDLSAAEELFTAVVEYPHLNYGSIYLYAACGLAQTLQVQGRAAEARSAIGAACTFFQETANTALLPIALAFQAELHLQQGQLVAASQWAAWFDRIPPLQPIFGTFSPHLTLVKIWLTENTATSRGRAASLLAEFREFVESIHNTRFLIEALALEALYHETDGETQVALDTLEQAIILAQPGGFIRLFVDLGPQMIRLLQQLHRSSVAQPYIGRILTAVRETPASVSRSTSLAEPLTDRELDVLTLLGQRLSYKEIAEQLFISPVTVKSHAIKVYQKLEVDGRHQAVEKAVDLGLLSRQ